MQVKSILPRVEGENRVLFTSGNVVYKTMPFIPPQAFPFELIESLEKMQELDTKVLVPGHGNICDKTYLPK